MRGTVDANLEWPPLVLEVPGVKPTCPDAPVVDAAMAREFAGRPGHLMVCEIRRRADDAAAEILQQQRVIEFGDLVLAEADFPAEFDADTAASYTMSAGCPSVRSSAWLSAPSSSESVILSSCPGAYGSMVEAPDNYGRQKRRVALPKPHQITRGLTGCNPGGVHAQVIGKSLFRREMLLETRGQTRPNCLAIWGQQAQLGSGASSGGRS